MFEATVKLSLRLPGRDPPMGGRMPERGGSVFSVQTLTTDRLDLVPLDPDRDAESLHAMYADPEFYPFGPREPTADVAATRTRLAEEMTGSGGWTGCSVCARGPMPSARSGGSPTKARRSVA